MQVSEDKELGAERLSALYDKYYERIYAFCVHRLFSKTSAEDVTSQVFLAAAAGFGKVHGQSEQSLAAWLYAIAANQCNCWLRTNLRRQRLFETFTKQYQPHHESKPDADWPQVYHAISKLKEVEQTIITLRFFEDLTTGEIAPVVNKPESTVRVILHRGLKKLRTMLNPADCGFGDSHE